MKNKQYILGTKGIGVSRLEIQGEIFDRQSEPFLKKWVKPSMNILEVGCGAGNVTLLLAKLLNNTGHLTAIDLTEEYATLTKNKIIKQKFKNVSVQQLPLEAADQLNMKFDLICGRAVLHHVINPQNAIINLRKLLKPKGMIVFEEPILSNWMSYPENKHYQKLAELFIKLGKKKRLDFEIGSKLQQLYIKAKINVVHYEFAQPALLTQKERSIIPSLAIECRDAFVKEKLITSTNLLILIKKLIDLVKTKNTLIYTEMAQIVGRK